MKKMKAADLGIDMKPRLETLKVEAPAERKGGGKVNLCLQRSPYKWSDQVIRLLTWMS